MTRNIKFVSLLCIVALMNLTACSTGHVGVKNYAGTVVTYIDATPEQITNAAVNTIRELKLTLISSSWSTLDGEVVARTAQDKKVDIEIKGVGQNISKIEIRVGVWGDEAMSVRILDKIKAKLGKNET